MRNWEIAQSNNPELKRIEPLDQFNMIHLIKEIIEVEPFILTLRFNSGEIREVNLNDKLHGWGKTQDSPYAELRQPEEFMKVQLDENFGSIQWPSGIDLCPDGAPCGISTPSKNM